MSKLISLWSVILVTVLVGACAGGGVGSGGAKVVFDDDTASDDDTVSDDDSISGDDTTAFDDDTTVSDDDSATDDDLTDDTAVDDDLDDDSVSTTTTTVPTTTSTTTTTVQNFAVIFRGHTCNIASSYEYSEFSLSSSFTAELWVGHLLDELDGRTLMKDQFNSLDDLAHGFWLGLEPVHGWPEFRVAGADAGSPCVATGNQSLSDGQWHHVAGVYDGAACRLFVDGHQVGGGTATFSAMDEQWNGFTVGAFDVNYDYTPWVTVDEVRLSNVARYAEQTVFSPPAQFEIDDPYVAGLWHLDEGTGDFTYGHDSTGRTLDGTIWCGAPDFYSWVAGR